MEASGRGWGGGGSLCGWGHPRTFLPGAMWMFSTPPRMPAQTLERNGFQTRYSVLTPSFSTEIFFSP